MFGLGLYNKNCTRYDTYDAHGQYQIAETRCKVVDILDVIGITVRQFMVKFAMPLYAIGGYNR